MDSEPSVLGELKAGARRNLWPLLILTAMALLFFARFLRTDTLFLMRDLFQKHYPLHIYSREILRHGALPLWNPYTGCGEPFLANIEGAVLYPPNLLYLLLPVTLATAVLVIFHTWLTAVAGYALCRVWQVSRLGSLLAATMLSFNTYWLTHIEFLPSHAAIAWFPVGVAAVRALGAVEARAVDRAGRAGAGHSNAGGPSGERAVPARRDRAVRRHARPLGSAGAEALARVPAAGRRVGGDLRAGDSAGDGADPSDVGTGARVVHPQRRGGPGAGQGLRESGNAGHAAHAVRVRRAGILRPVLGAVVLRSTGPAVSTSASWPSSCSSARC